jgi:cobalamin-dependent methionine synthase I
MLPFLPLEAWAMVAAHLPMTSALEAFSAVTRAGLIPTTGVDRHVRFMAFMDEWALRCRAAALSEAHAHSDIWPSYQGHQQAIRDVTRALVTMGFRESDAERASHASFGSFSLAFDVVLGV